MADPSLFFWVMVPAALIGGFLRGFAGFGGPLFMMPLLGAFLAPPAAVAVMMWVDLLANVLLLPEARRHVSRAVVVPLTIGTALTMPPGVLLLLSLDAVVMKRTICAVILVAALVLLSGWRYRRPVGSGTYAAVGAAGGLVMGVTSIAAVTPLFLSAGRRSAAENRADFIVWVFLATILLLAILAARGALDAGDGAKIAALAPAYLAGIFAGTRWHRRASDAAVRRTVLLLIIAVAGMGLIAT